VCGYELEPQQHIRQLRTNLLAGRGPGASATELAAHQHQRVDFGPLPVTAAREEVAVATRQAAARQPGAAQRHASRELVAARPAGARPRRPAHGRVVRAFTIGVVVGLVVGQRSRDR
jgi:hypothetical protein